MANWIEGMPYMQGQAANMVSANLAVDANGHPLPQLVDRQAHRWQTTSVYDVPSASRPGHVWRVEFVANLAGTRAYCGCRAGRAGRRCWHAAAVEGLELGEPVRRRAIVPAATNDDLWGPR